MSLGQCSLAHRQNYSLSGAPARAGAHDQTWQIARRYETVAVIKAIFPLVQAHADGIQRAPKKQSNCPRAAKEQMDFGRLRA